MTIEIDKLINVLNELFQNTNIKASVDGSIKGGVITGASAVLGGLLLGPLGLAIGGAIGGTASAISSSFKPVFVILKGMSNVEKRKLCDHLIKAFEGFGIQDFAVLATLLLQCSSYQEIAIKEVIKYLRTSKGFRIQYE